MDNSGCYLNLLAKEQLSLTHHLQSIAPRVGNLRSMNSVYRRDLQKAQEDLADYFNRSLHRPFNCLLLGPPGSGKSFIAKQLSNFGDTTKSGGLRPTQENERNRVKQAKVLEFNLSQLYDPRDLTKIFEEIAREKNEAKIVLLDEFDVRIGSTSVIRYLIEAMYDGKILGAHELGKTAFIFSGSYLSDKRILSKIQKENSQIDLPRFIFEYSYKAASNGDAKANEEVDRVFHMCEAYRKYQEEMSPESHAILYLRQLDKLSDFLSRINGFVIEVPNLSAPLEITEPPGVLWTNNGACGRLMRSICAKSSGVAETVIDWAETESQNDGKMPRISDLYNDYTCMAAPALQYKDVLLKERLYIFLTTFDNERKNRREKREPANGMRWKNETVVIMKRNLLNYICAAPLIHGMRSLNTLMWNLEAVDGRPDGGEDSRYDAEGREQYTITLGDPENVTRHVRQEGDYVDPSRLWDLIKRENNLAIDGESYIDIILDDRDGKLRVWDAQR